MNGCFFFFFYGRPFLLYVIWLFFVLCLAARRVFLCRFIVISYWLSPPGLAHTYTHRALFLYGVFYPISVFSPFSFCNFTRTLPPSLPPFLLALRRYCFGSNPAEAHLCELCFLPRSRSERGGGSLSPPGLCGKDEHSISGRGGGGVGGGSSGDERSKRDEKGLSLREARLWSNLVELRGVPSRDSLAEFPEGLGEFEAFFFLLLLLLLMVMVVVLFVVIVVVVDCGGGCGVAFLVDDLLRLSFTSRSSNCEMLFSRGFV